MADGDDERQTRLDGNAAAGLLAEVFRCEPSDMMLICAGCGEDGPMGALLAYGLELGAILRCPACNTAVLRAGSAGARLWIDLRGAVSLRVEVGG
jgi:hypothetical protein